MDDKCPFSDPSRHPSWPTPCHGHPRMPWHGCMVSVVSHGTMVGPTRRKGGCAGRAGLAVSERNLGEKKYRATGDKSRLTGPDRASNTTRNNFVCEL
jgi:hypothetical protein